MNEMRPSMSSMALDSVSFVLARMVMFIFWHILRIDTLLYSNTTLIHQVPEKGSVETA